MGFSTNNFHGKLDSLLGYASTEQAGIIMLSKGQAMGEITNNSGLLVDSETGRCSVNVPTTDAKFGLRRDSCGQLQVVAATDEEIKDETNEHNPITPSNLHTAVESVGDTRYVLNGSELFVKHTDSLPPWNLRYTYDTEDGIFDTIERCTAAVSDGVMIITAAANAGNKYALARLDFPDTESKLYTIEFDMSMESGRWIIGMGDREGRPGDSSKTSYDSSGIAFTIGTLNGTYLYIQNELTAVECGAKWLHVEIILDGRSDTAYITVYDKSTGDIVYPTSGAGKAEKIFLTPGAEINMLEVYSYIAGTLLIDNLSIIYGNDMRAENIIYSIEDGSGAAKLYIYPNEDRYIVVGEERHEYSKEPKQIGMWINGDPVWRTVIDRVLTEEEIANNTVSLTAEDTGIKNVDVAIITGYSLSVTDDMRDGAHQHMLVQASGFTFDGARSFTDNSYSRVMGMLEYSAPADSMI